MAVSDRIRDIRKCNGMSQITKALNVSVHYLMDWQRMPTHWHRQTH